MRGRDVLFVGGEDERQPVFGRGDVTVERVETRADALETMADSSVDCVVSCQALPDGTGVELCRTIRETFPDLPFVLLTDDCEPALAREAVSVGIDGFLPAETVADGEEVAAEVADLLAVDETQRRYRRLVEQTTDVITVLDPDGTVQYVSPSIEETMGYEQSDLVGELAVEYVHPDDRATVSEALEERIRGASDQLSFEYRIRNADGEYRWVETRAQNFVEDPAIEGIVVSSRDITERKERERELERHQEFLQRTQEVANVGAWEYDCESETLEWSDEVYCIHDLPFEFEPTPGKALDFYHPADREQIETAFEDLIEDGEPYDIESRIVTADDELRWVTTRGAPQYEDGEVVGALGVFQDITERKERENRYSTLVEEANDGIVIADDERIKFVNREMADLLGSTPEQIEGQSIFEFIAEGDHDRIRENYENRRDGGQDTGRYETRLETVDGEHVPVEVNASLVRYNGDVADMGIVRDITARKERERELEMYERMLNAVPDMVYALDENGRFLAINQTGEAILDRQETDLIGRHVTIAMDEADRERGQKHIQDLLSDDARRKAIYEMDLYAADGESTPVENHVALLRDEDGEFGGSVGVIRDVRDRKRRENRLTVLNRALRHDLRNSMHVILANAELLEGAATDEETISKLETIQRRAEDINSLSEKAREIEQTLGEEGQRTRVDIAVLTRNLLTYFREEYPDVEFEADVPQHTWVEAVPLIDTAIENLIENSIEHTDDPRVRVSVTDESETIRVTIADDGPGIPEKEQRVVEQGSETPLDHASGLGLWLVAWITRDSGGEVVFEQETEQVTGDDGSDDEWDNAVTLVLQRAESRSDEAGEGIESDA
jgi:PAS domain S-box-containing protein